MATKKLESEINRLGGVIVKESLFPGGKPFKTIKCNDGLSEEEQVKVHSILEEENIKNFGISYYEFEEVENLRQELDKYLAKLSG
jgi:hypothetical protein